ncbi:MAG: single-stranded DNA-binding protein [Actinobacteria bacterium HGW-Actinobacteria-7]|nr:MAG: single-stranded DNA-binding protein [Actinobacteria bacterium HGW-Actinobacteria-7]
MFGIGSSQQAKVRVWVRPEVLAELTQPNEQSSEEESDDEPLPVELQLGDSADLSDEELDRVADIAVAALRSVLGCFGIENATVEEYEGDEGEIILDVVGGDYGLLIGRHGKTLDALQTAVGAITTHQSGFRYPVVVDVEGYRHRRRQKIEDIARRAADRAARQHMAVRLRPMTAYERRVVHVALRGDKRVTTASDGADPFRQVVIAPK